MLATGVRQLSQTSLQRRFLSPKPSLSKAELRYLTEVDGHAHVALVAEHPPAWPAARTLRPRRDATRRSRCRPR